MSHFACEIQVWRVGPGSLLCLKFGELVLDAFLHLGVEIDELLRLLRSSSRNSGAFSSSGEPRTCSHTRRPIGRRPSRRISRKCRR